MLCVPVHGQIAVPPLQVPQLPVQTPDLDRTVDAVTGRVGDLREVRRLRIRNLLRTNRAVLEADPRGAPMLRNEVTAFSPTDEALARAQASGFTVTRTRTLDGLDATIVVLQAPAGMSTRRALERLRDADPAGTYDFNHVYSAGGESLGAATPRSNGSDPSLPVPAGPRSV